MGDSKGSISMDQSMMDSSVSKGSDKVWPGLSAIREKVEESGSCVELVTHKQHLALSPKYIGKINQGIKAHLNEVLHCYSTELGGVPLAYSRVQLLQPCPLIVDDLPHLHLAVEVDLYVFRPQEGQHVTATVNKLGKSHIGCVVHNCFNATIAKPKDKGDTPWKGDKLKLGDSVLLRVKKVISHNGELSIRARLPGD